MACVAYSSSPPMYSWKKNSLVSPGDSSAADAKTFECIPFSSIRFLRTIGKRKFEGRPILGTQSEYPSSQSSLLNSNLSSIFFAKEHSGKTLLRRASGELQSR